MIPLTQIRNAVAKKTIMGWGLIKKQDFLSAPEKRFPPSGFPKGGDAYDIINDARGILLRI